MELPIMSDVIDTIRSLMPSSSNFAGSDVEEILDETIGPYFDNKENDIEEMLNAPFLTTATGEYLDLIHGKLYGLERLPEEEDDDYRKRLSFKCKNKLTINTLIELDCNVYAKPEDVTFDEDTVLTSRNTSLTPMIIIECPSDEVEDLIKDNLIWEKVAVFL